MTIVQCTQLLCMCHIRVSLVYFLPHESISEASFIVCLITFQQIINREKQHQQEYNNRNNNNHKCDDILATFVKSALKFNSVTRNVMNEKWLSGYQTDMMEINYN